jgi:serine/threonine protein kinase
MLRMTAADTIKELHVQVKRCPECGTGFGLEAAFCPFDGVGLKTSTWDPTRDPLTDTVIDSRYEVVEPLGEGGMGTVYKVRHVTLDRMFAMKILRRDLAADPGLAARFLQEARATAAIRHPSVVAISDFGELDDGAPYFVMDLLVGETLATRMRARGLLPPREAASIARKLADALSAAHAANVVHRDLKPENVFLVGVAAGRQASDELRIVDFGAAKIMGGSKLTRPGVVFGTPYYMSPEQASGQTVDARADIYSLGVLLYEMITGAVPFEADTYMGVLTKHMFAAPTKPSERAPGGVQLGELEAVVLRALEKEPSARYQTMVELSSAIEKAIDGRQSAAPKGDPRTRTVPFMGMSTADKIQRSVTRQLLEDRRRRRRGIVVASVSAATTLALCAFAVTIFDNPSSSQLPKAEPAPPPATESAVASAAPPPPSLSFALSPSFAPALSSSSTSPPVTTRPKAAAPDVPAARLPPRAGPAPASTTGSTSTPTSAAPPRARSPDELPDPWKR